MRRHENLPPWAWQVVKAEHSHVPVTALLMCPHTYGDRGRAVRNTKQHQPLLQSNLGRPHCCTLAHNTRLQNDIIRGSIVTHTKEALCAVSLIHAHTPGLATTTSRLRHAVHDKPNAQAQPPQTCNQAQTPAAGEAPNRDAVDGAQSHGDAAQPP